MKYTPNPGILRPSIYFLLASALALVCALSANAAGTTTWSGGGAANQNWSASANWTTVGGSTPPGTTDAVVFRTTGASNSPTVNNIVDTSTTIASLLFTNETANIYHTTQIPSGTLTVSGAITVGGTNQTATYTVTGAGTLKGGAGNSVFTVATGNGGNLTNDLSGLNNFVWNAGGSGAAFNVGLDPGYSSGGILKLAAVSNTITATTLTIGNNNNGGSSFLFLGAGTNIINANTIELGDAKASGTLQFNSGTGGLRLRNAAGTGRTTVDVAGTPGHSGGSGSPAVGNILLNGHPVDMMINTLTLGNRGGRGASSAGGANNAATFVFNSGVVDATNIVMAVNSSGGTNVASTLSVGGGTLKVGAGGISLVNNGGGAINTGKLIVTNSGVVASAGSIVKTTVAGTGTISVTNGTITLTSASATIGISGTPIDIINLSGAALHLRLDANNISTTAIVATTVNTNGVNTITIDSVINGSGALTFPLISYTGTDPFGSFAPVILPTGYTGNLVDDTANHLVSLSVSVPTSIPLAWVGATNSVLVSNWDTNKTQNWVDQATLSVAQVYADPDAVLFDDSASTNIVTLITSNAPASVMVNNSSFDYTFNGGGRISGATGLTKQGSAALTLAESGGDNFSGGITNNGGTLILDNTNSAMSGGLVISSGTTVQVGLNDGGGTLPAGTLDDEGALIINRANNFTVSTAITGTGSLTQTGNGTLTLSAANTFTGATVASKGKLALTVAGALSTSSGLLVSNATFDVSAISGSVNLNDFSLTNATINLGVPANLLAPISVNTFESDGTVGQSNIINVTALPGIAFYPSTVTLIKSTNAMTLAGGNFNFALGSLPAASPNYAGTLSESGDGTAILLTLTAGPVGVRSSVTWNGTNNVSVTTNWSDNINWILPGLPVAADKVIFNDQTTVSDGTTNNVVDASFGGTISSLAYSQIGDAQFQNTFIPGGVILNVTGTGGLTVGSPNQLSSVASPVTTFSGSGKLAVNNASANVNVTIGEPGSSGTATLNLTNLDTFNFAGARLLVGVSGPSRSTGVLYLARTNAISLSGSSPQLDIGDNGGNNGPGSALYLGRTNVIFADSVAMGRQKQNSGGGGVLRFNPAITNDNPVVYFRGADGVSRVSTWAIGDGAGNGGTATFTGLTDFSGGTVNAVVDAMWLGKTSTSGSAGTGSVKGTLTFSGGTINVNNLTNGMQSSSLAFTITAAVNVNGTGVLTVNNNLVMASVGSSTGTTTASLNITNGTVLANSITSGGGTSTINLTDGTLVVSNNAGTLASPIGTLNLSDNGTTDTRIQLDAAVGKTNIFATAITASGVTTIDIKSLAGVTNTMQIPIISYAGPSPIAGLTVGTIPTGYSGASLVDSGTTIDLAITPPAPTVWVGAVGPALNSSWDFSTHNWNNGTPVAYADIVFAQFDDTASNNVATLTTTVSPASLNVSNNVLNYTFNGAGNIHGPITLLKQGAGTLILDNSGSNDFSGGINIVGGTVQSGNNDASGNLPVAGGIADNGILAFNRTDNFTVPNLISGAGGVTQAGTGTNRPTAVNTYSGATLISGGTLVASNATIGLSSIGAVAGPCFITNGGTLDVENSAAQSMSFTNLTDNGGKQFYIAGAGVGGNGAIVNNGTVNQQNAFQNVALTGDATVGGPTRWDMRVPSGHFSPILNLNGFTLTKTGPNQMSMVSLIVTNGGNLVINSGTFSFENTSSNATTHVQVNAGGSMGHFRQVGGLFTAPMTMNGGAITNLTGTGASSVNDSPITLTANSILGGGSSATNAITLNGVISEQGGSYGLTKVGTGPFIFTTNCTYSGNTVINNGALVLSGNGSISNSAVISIAAGATLDVNGRTDQTLFLGAGRSLTGFGSVTGLVTSASGAIIAPGSATAVGSLTVSSTANLNGATWMKLNRSVSPSNDVLNASTIIYGGDTASGILIVTNVGPALVAGDKFKLFNASIVTGSFSSTNLPSLNAGLYWTNSAGGVWSVVGSVNTSPTNITISVSGNVMTLSWPADHTGWHLQSQTNSLSSGLSVGGTWTEVPGSTSVNSVNVTINPANPTVFYRLVYP